jgi:ribosome-associated toxin RatA of RatAB toxin-antitoxin module
MHIEDTLVMRAGADEIYRLAAAIERWPDLLPHYRYVRIVRDDGASRIADMGARRDWIPVSWSAVQRRFPDERRIEFEHVRGATKGMTVEWAIRPAPGGCEVTLTHDFDAPWPLVGGRPTDLILGRYFVRGIAHRTLGCFKAIAEGSAPEQSGSEAGAVR